MQETIVYLTNGLVEGNLLKAPVAIKRASDGSACADITYRKAPVGRGADGLLVFPITKLEIPSKLGDAELSVEEWPNREGGLLRIYAKNPGVFQEAGNLEFES